MTKFIMIALSIIFLSACAAENRMPTGQVELKDLGPAPELKNETWLNSDQPLRLAELRGKVVLLDMWTFG